MPALDCPPFPLEFRRARLTAPAPVATTAPVQLSAAQASKIASIEHVEAYVAGALATSLESRKRKVKFSAPKVEPPAAHFHKIDLQGGYYYLSPRDALTDVIEPAGESRNEFGVASE